MANVYFDQLVVKNDGTLRHLKIAKIITDSVSRDPQRIPSDHLNSTPALIFSSKNLGYLVVLDEPIESYHAWICKQRIADLEEAKREAQWKKVVEIAELVSFFVPLLGIGGVTCMLLRGAVQVSEMIAGADKLYGLITKPEEVITEGLVDFVIGKSCKKFCHIDKPKLGKDVAVFDVFDAVTDKAIESTGVKDKLSKKIQVSALGYSVDYSKISRARTEYDLILANIHAFRYQYDSSYKNSYDLFQNITKNLANSMFGLRGNPAPNGAKPFFVQGK